MPTTPVPADRARAPCRARRAPSTAARRSPSRPTSTPGTTLVGHEVAGPGHREVTMAACFRRFATTEAVVLEVPEPSGLRSGPRHVASSRVPLAGLLREAGHEVCAYAMENNSIDVLVRGGGRLPWFAVTVVSRRSWAPSRGWASTGSATRAGCTRRLRPSPLRRRRAVHDRARAAARRPCPVPCPSERSSSASSTSARACESSSGRGRGRGGGAGSGARLIGAGPLSDEVHEWAAEAPGDAAPPGRMPHAAAPAGRRDGLGARRPVRARGARGSSRSASPSRRAWPPARRS